MRTNVIVRRAQLVVSLLTLSGLLGTVHAEDDKLTHHVAALSSKLSANERGALGKIAAPERKLLALRAYLRAGKNLESRWSWTEEQIRSYERSDEYRRLLSDIDAITNEFERRNPGYTLYANTQVRSLDTQLERWNANPRVGTTASNLYRAAQHALADSPTQPNAASLDAFERFLKQWRPSPTAPLAAPGLSLHGQSRAIDFQIMKAGKIVAATELGAVAREWEAPGWHLKLKQAVHAASARFKGPLPAPNEPWHYEYGPGDRE